VGELADSDVVFSEDTVRTDPAMLPRRCMPLSRIAQLYRCKVSIDVKDHTPRFGT
jgi:hypothetical protein